MMTTGRLSHGGGERGSAVLLALGFLILMLVIGMVFMDTAISERHIARNRAGNDQAKAAAEAGVAQIKRLVLATPALRPAQTVYPPNASNSDGDDFLGNLAVNFKDCLYFSRNGPELSPAEEYNPFSQYVVWAVDRSGKLDPNYFGRPSTSKLPSISSYAFRPVGASPVDIAFLNMSTAFQKSTPAATDFDGWWRFGNSSAPEAWQPYDQTHGLKQMYETVYPPAQADSLWVCYETWKEATLPAQTLFNQAPAFPWTHAFTKGAENQVNTYCEDLDVNGNGIIDTGDTDFNGNGRLDISPRVPLGSLAAMLQNLSATSRLPSDLTPSISQAESSSNSLEQAGGLPWLATLRNHRYWADDVNGDGSFDPGHPEASHYAYASYLELLANFKDFADADSLPTTNLDIVLAINSYDYSDIQPSTALPASYNGNAATSYYCGTEAVPALSGLQLHFNENGIYNATVELANLYPAQYALNSGEDLNGNGILDAGEDLNGNGILDGYLHKNLAVVAEIKWRHGATEEVQKLVMADWTNLYNSQTLMFSQSCAIGSKPAAPVTLATTDEIEAVNLYLFSAPGLSQAIKNAGSNTTTINAALHNNAVLLDAWALVCPPDPADATKSAVKLTNASDKSANALGHVTAVVYEGDPATTLVPDRELFYYPGTGPSDPNAGYYLNTIGATKSINDLYRHAVALSPQPNGAGWHVSGLKTTLPTKAGGLYYGGNNLYVYKSVGFSTAIGKVTANAAGYKSAEIYFSARDPRNNTRWYYPDTNKRPDPTNPMYQFVSAFEVRSYSDTTTVSDAVPGSATEVAAKPGRVGQLHSAWFLRQAASSYFSEDDAVDATSASAVYAAMQGTDYPIPSTAYVRNDGFKTLWELGAVNRAELWRTVRIGDVDFDERINILYGALPDGSYKMGDWPVLDQLCLNRNNIDEVQNAAWLASGAPSERAKINPSTHCQEMFRTVLGSLTHLPATASTLPIEAYNDAPYNEATGIFDDTYWTGNNARLLSTSQIDSLVPALADKNYISRGRLAATITQGMANNSSFGSWSDRDIEQVLGRAANLFDTRLRYYEVVSLGRYCQYLEEKGSPADNRIPDDVKSSVFNHLILEEDTYKPSTNSSARFTKAWNLSR